MSISKELFEIAAALRQFEEFSAPELDELNSAAEAIGKAWSGSWLGYHSKVYYADFQEPPPGAAFSQEWGMQDAFSRGSRGDWREYNYDDVVSLINHEAGEPDLSEISEKADNAKKAFEEAKAKAESLVYANIDPETDKFTKRLVDEIESDRILTATDVINHLRPSGKMISRDMIAIEKGLVTPPHISVIARVFALKQPFL